MNAALFLAEEVYVCRPGRYYIFLDLRRDRYVSVSSSKSAALARQVFGWDKREATEDHHSTPALEAEDTTLADELLSEGILTCTPPAAHIQRHTEIPPPEADVRSNWTEGGLTVPSCLPRMRLPRALLRAHIELAIVPLRSIVATLHRRKSRSPHSRSPSALRRTIRLARRFSEYRPYFPRDYLCLYDSLALVYYLALHDLYPMWVFGVCEEPFYAHCWVQAGTVVLNDYCERVSRYTPVMSV